MSTITEQMQLIRNNICRQVSTTEHGEAPTKIKKKNGNFMLSSLCCLLLLFFLQWDCAQESSTRSSTKLSERFAKCIFLNWSKHCSNRLPKELSKTFFLQELYRMWSWTSTEQQTLKSTFVTTLPNIANALFSYLGWGFSWRHNTSPLPCRCSTAKNIFLQLHFQSSSVKLCAVENAIQWEKPPHFLHLYLPFCSKML